MKLFIITCLLSFGLFTTLQAQDNLFPVIKGYGAIVPVPFETEKPDPESEYKLIYELSFRYDDKAKFYRGLDYAARIVNAHAYAGVPKENLEMVIVISSGATPLVLNSETYQKRFDVPNPNAEVLDKLLAAGVKIVVCGQSMVKQDIVPNQVHKGISLAASRITATSDLLNKGYHIF